MWLPFFCGRMWSGCYSFSNAKYLGVVFDPFLSFDTHVGEICRSSFYSFRSISTIRPYLDRNTLLMIINACVFSRLDYCNAVFAFCNKSSVLRLQRVQNCFSRLVFRLPRSSPTTLAIKRLGWLRIEHRIVYKLLCVIHKCLFKSSPNYLNTLLTPAASSTTSFSLRSHQALILKCPISRSSFVRRSFSFYAPRLWSALPSHVRSIKSHSLFKKIVKARLL